MNNSTICVAAMTQAARAKKLLTSAGIAASIQKSDCGGDKVGCSFEVAVPPSQLSRAAELLKKNGMRLL